MRLDESWVAFVKSVSLSFKVTVNDWLLYNIWKAMHGYTDFGEYMSMFGRQSLKLSRATPGISASV